MTFETDSKTVQFQAGEGIAAQIGKVEQNQRPANGFRLPQTPIGIGLDDPPNRPQDRHAMRLAHITSVYSIDDLT